MHRRSLLRIGTAAGTAAMLSLVGCDRNPMVKPAATTWMPDEAAPHDRTWMAFGASQRIWGRRLLGEVRHNLAAIAQAIARYEPVSMLVRPEEYDLAAQMCGAFVDLVVAPLDDLWVRDTGPVFVKDGQGRLGGIDFNFNGWGQKQAHRHDAQVAELIIRRVGGKLINTSLVLEGGALEVDGEGTAIITESCVLNRNRNPGMTQADCEAILKPLLGLQKIIWLPGIRGRDITDGHTDFYARFARPGVVVAGYEPDPNSFDHGVTKRHLDILRGSRDAHGRQLEIAVIESPSRIRPRFERAEFAAGYINFYVVNGAVMAPEFGDAIADSRAQSILQDCFPNRDIIQLNIDGLAAGGGGIHCTTQQQPRL